MRFNFVYFQKWFPIPISRILEAEDLETAINHFNFDTDQLTGNIYPKDVRQIDENTWVKIGPARTSGYIIATEASTYFNVDIYMRVKRQTTRSLQVPEFIDMIDELFF